MAKGAQAFRTISEAAEEIGVAQHVLRFWETKFTFIRPMKRAGGRRFYRPSDIAVLATVRRLLHDDGYTIKNIQQSYRDSWFERPCRVRSEKSRWVSRLMVGAPTTERRASAGISDGDGLGGALRALEAAKRRLDALLERG